MLPTVAISDVMGRINAISTTFAPAPAVPATRAGGADFAGTLQQVLGAAGTPGPGSAGSGRRALAIAAGEVGQAEMPPGSNDSSRIATYRTATAGSGVGPWCAYFVSWAAQQAGTPLGPEGKGFGRVDDIWAWASETGRALPPGATPQPGDLFVLDEHMGIIDRVLPDGSIATIEGNYKDAVTREVRQPSEAVGFVRLG